VLDLGRICRSYGATHARWRRGDGSEAVAEGAGGSLQRAVDTHGVGPLAAALASGEGLWLRDGDVELQVSREDSSASMRVSWDEGPSYQERFTVTPNATLPADPGPGARSAMPQAPSSGAASPVAPAPSRGVRAGAQPVSDVAAALHDPALPLAVGPDGLYVLDDAVGLPVVPAVDPASLGAPSFRQAHGVRAAYVAGAMAGGIASADLVVAMGRAGLLGFFGAGGLPLVAVEQACKEVTAALGDAPCGFNLLHNPVEPHVEEATVDLYLSHGIRRVSASAYMRLTRAVVRYRLHGIHAGTDGQPVCPNKVFAKVSRAEVAEPFMRPAPKRLVEALVAEGLLTTEQAALAAQVPVAEDVTAEADSGGHTDRRPLVVLLPTLLALRDRVSAEEGYGARGITLRVGAGGGLGDPASVAAAFTMGADYVLTGSINQSCIQADTSKLAKEMVSAAGMADMAQGAAPDMFEIGAHVQVLGRGSVYAQRANKLHGLYKTYGDLDALPAKERQRLEKTLFRRPLDEVWADTRAYWAQRDPKEVERAERDPRHKLALTFRWYLGMSSRWARMGTEDRKRDFQIWCGPSMGRFNDWVRGTWLEPLEARDAVAVARCLLRGAAAIRRVEVAAALGVTLPTGVRVPPPHAG